MFELSEEQFNIFLTVAAEHGHKAFSSFLAGFIQDQLDQSAKSALLDYARACDATGNMAQISWSHVAVDVRQWVYLDMHKKDNDDA